METKQLLSEPASIKWSNLIGGKQRLSKACLFTSYPPPISHLEVFTIWTERFGVVSFSPSEKGYVYFAGDTGWGPHFEAIAEKFKPMALSILPIGAYEPQWFMRPFHINPEQAVDAHILLESKQSIGVHWGTFRLSDEMRFEPIWDLRMALMDEYVSSSSFQALPPGASLEL